MTKNHWIDHWEPDDEEFWESTGKRVARKNLGFSMLTDHLAFCIWLMWTIVVLNLADIGITTVGVGPVHPHPGPQPDRFDAPGALRFRHPALGRAGVDHHQHRDPPGTRTAVAVLVPSGWLASQSSGTQFWVLLACAATAGVGGANFASSMANISFFYPERKKGVLIQVILRQASLGISALEKAATTPAAKVAIANSHSTWSVPALWVFIGAYVVLGGVTWFAYLRSPAPADASLAGVLS
ncbi:MAG: hypothetical protein ACRDWV_05505 [Acidimicrobiales bacterium]